MNKRKKRPNYTREFKDDAVKLVVEHGYTCNEVARRLGIAGSNVTRWVRLYRQDQEDISETGVTRREVDMGIDELLGISDHNDQEAYKDIKPGLARKLRQASQLPPGEIKALSTFIDALIIKQQVNNDSAGAAK